MDFLAAISALFGWVYTIAWSLSFYPQPLLNAKRRTTSGTTVDFPLINCLGFLSYLLSTGAMRYSATVRAEYAARHHGLTPTVATNDVVFAAHALILSLFGVSQYLLPQLWGWNADREENDGTREGLLAGDSAVVGYDGRQQHQQQQVRRRRVLGGNTKPSNFILGIMAGCITGVGFVVLLVFRDNAAGTAVDAMLATTTTSSRWQWLDVVYALGYVKVVVTLVKYSPQVLVNWRNRSTQGWSIYSMLLDFIGGVLSIAQLLIDSYRQHDWSGLTGNPVKLLLGNVSMAYDLVFFAQHYILYPEDSRGEGKDRAYNEDAEEGSSRARDGVLE